MQEMCIVISGESQRWFGFFKFRHLRRSSSHYRQQSPLYPPYLSISEKKKKPLNYTSVHLTDLP